MIDVQPKIDAILARIKQHQEDLKNQQKYLAELESVFQKISNDISVTKNNITILSARIFESNDNLKLLQEITGKIEEFQ